jgi:hypothetical protein
MVRQKDGNFLVWGVPGTLKSCPSPEQMLLPSPGLCTPGISSQHPEAGVAVCKPPSSLQLARLDPGPWTPPHLPPGSLY